MYTNHFLPVTKLINKVRDGSRLKRMFDAPRTPYQRVLDSTEVSDEHKAKLHAMHATLDVVELKQQIDDMIAHIPASKVG